MTLPTVLTFPGKRAVLDSSGREEVADSPPGWTDLGDDYFRFGALVGLKNLSDYLLRIGIKSSVDALETRRRRYGLPPRGSAQGHPVPFTRADVDVWMLNLVGVDLDLWIAQYRRDRNHHRIANTRRGPRPRWERPLSAIAGEFPRRLFAVIELYAGRMEQVYRNRDNGTSYCALSEGRFGSKLLGDDLLYAGGTIGVWRYDHARRSTAADLRVPRYDRRRRKDTKARSLIVAYCREPGQSGILKVPGEFFGLEKGTWTDCITSNRLPRFVEMCTWMEENHPAFIWLTFTRRVAINPMTLEARVPTVLSNRMLIDDLPDGDRWPHEEDEPPAEE